MKARHGSRPSDDDRARWIAFGSHLRDARTTLGLSADELADLLPPGIRVSGQMIRLYERGRSAPSPAMVDALERALLRVSPPVGVESPIGPGALSGHLWPVVPSQEDGRDMAAEIVLLRARVAELEARLALTESSPPVAPDPSG